jgi:hypothetical protein
MEKLVRRTRRYNSRWRDLARMRTSIRARTTKIRSIRSLSRAEGVAESVTTMSGVLELIWYVRSILRSFFADIYSFRRSDWTFNRGPGTLLLTITKVLLIIVLNYYTSNYYCSKWQK